MKKLIKKIETCRDCVYLMGIHNNSMCAKTSKKIEIHGPGQEAWEKWEIPDWCPLDDWT